MPFEPPSWRPKNILRFIESVGSSTNVMHVETDCGEGYLKALGNPEGPHALARELIGTRLADLVGLPTLACALIDIRGDDELPFRGGGKAFLGPAFVTRREAGLVWSGKAGFLTRVKNTDTISELVVFDTWIRNRDRYSSTGGVEKRNPDNVFLSREGIRGRKLRLIAMDHTHCFDTGTSLTTRVSNIGNVQDEAVYGLFPEFREFLNSNAVIRMCAQLRVVARSSIEEIVNAVPREWAPDEAVRHALVAFILERAQFVADTIADRIFAQGELKV